MPDPDLLDDTSRLLQAVKSHHSWGNGVKLRPTVDTERLQLAVGPDIAERPLAKEHVDIVGIVCFDDRTANSTIAVLAIRLVHKGEILVLSHPRYEDAAFEAGLALAHLSRRTDVER